MEELIQKLKQQIIEELQLYDVVADDFDGDTILFGEGLGLDSIDGLQLVVLLDKQYGVKIEDPKERRTALATVRTMANYILAHQGADRSQRLSHVN